MRRTRVALSLFVATIILAVIVAVWRTIGRTDALIGLVASILWVGIAVVTFFGLRELA